MSDQVKETGMDQYRKLQAEAKELGINGNMKAGELKKAIADKKAELITNSGTKPESEVKGPTGISPKDAKSIEARLIFEEETRAKIRRDRQIAIDRAGIIAESETLNIPINLPDNPTELELARARQVLGIKKTEIKPSPETVAIEAGKRGYYIFTNREQEDASHTVNLGGKYTIHLIPDQVHVLSDFHIKRWRTCAVYPEYKRVPTGVQPSPNTTGQVVEKCVNAGGKPRFIFEYLGEAPQDAPFGLVTDAKILEGLKITI